MVQLNTTLSPSIVQASIGSLRDVATFATATITIAAGNAADQDTVTLIDAYGGSDVFEFESAGGITAGRIEVAVGGDNAASATNLADAINASGLAITATAALGVVTLTQQVRGPAGNKAVAETGSNISKTDFTGGTDNQDVLIIERIGANGDLLCSIQNNSETQPIALKVQQSDQNTVADYADLNVLVNGSSVSSVTVPVGGSLMFVIAGPGIGGQGPGVGGESQQAAYTLPRYLRFVCTNQSAANGQLSVSYYSGGIERRSLYG